MHWASALQARSEAAIVGAVRNDALQKRGYLHERSVAVRIKVFRCGRLDMRTRRKRACSKQWNRRPVCN